MTRRSSCPASGRLASSTAAMAWPTPGAMRSAQHQRRAARRSCVAGDLLLDGRAPSPQDAKQPPDVARRVGIARHGQALRLGCYVADDVLPARRQFGQPPSAGIDGPCRPETQADPFAQARAHPPGRSWPDVPWPTHTSNSQTKICELFQEITIPRRLRQRRWIAASSRRDDRAHASNSVLT